MISRKCSVMSEIVAGLGLLGVTFGAVFAGPNAGGVLLFHAHPEISASQAPCPEMSLVDCADAVSVHDGADAIVLGVYAAFPGEPRVTIVTFGIEYDTSIFINNYGHCGSAEITEGAWPNSGTGTSVAWSSPNIENVQPVYWFVAYDYYQAGGLFATGPHPESESEFLDDTNPPAQDPIADAGTFGFNGAKSYSPCPAVEGVGACCAWGSHSCTIVFEAKCVEGDFHGPGTVCEPSPCPVDPTGACCTDEGWCSIRTESRCGDLGRAYQGDGTTCQAPTCEPTAGVPDAESTELSSSSFRVHGSPTDGAQLRVSWDVPRSVDSIAEIVDAAGRRVLQVPVGAGAISFQWSASHAERLSSGSYWIRWTDGTPGASRFVVLR